MHVHPPYPVSKSHYLVFLRSLANSLADYKATVSNKKWFFTQGTWSMWDKVHDRLLWEAGHRKLGRLNCGSHQGKQYCCPGHVSNVGQGPVLCELLDSVHRERSVCLWLCLCSSLCLYKCIYYVHGKCRFSASKELFKPGGQLTKHPCNSSSLQNRAFWVPQIHNLDGIPTIIS